MDRRAAWPRVPSCFDVLVTPSEQFGLIAGEASLDRMGGQVDFFASDHHDRVAELRAESADFVHAVGFISKLFTVGRQINVSTGLEIRLRRSSGSSRLGHRWLRGFVWVGSGSDWILRTRSSIRARGIRRGFEMFGVRDFQGVDGLWRKSRRIEAE